MSKLPEKTNPHPLITQGFSTKKNSLGQKNEKSNNEMFAHHLLSVGKNSIFLLARIAMVRASEIDGGSPPLVKHHSEEKATTIALREISHGRIHIKDRK